METRTVKLENPIIVAGKEMTEVMVRGSTVGDEEDAMQQAVRLKRGDNPVAIELCLMAKLTRLPYDALRSMRGRDYANLRAALNELNGVENNPDENPTETAGTPGSD